VRLRLPAGVRATTSVVVRGRTRSGRRVVVRRGFQGCGG
jgi:hypothetical protein